MRGHVIGVVVTAALLALMSACSQQTPGAESTLPDTTTTPDAPLRVFVSVAPQAYLVERVGGEHVEVEVLVRPGESPATYAPSPRQMARLSEAALYFRVGVPFENGLMPKIESAMPRLRVVDTRAGVTLRRMQHHAHADEHAAEHKEHAEAHEHGDDGYDPHIWLSPAALRIQAHSVADALAEADPGHAEAYRANLEALLRDIDTTHAHITEILSPFKGQAFFVFHPAYGYFADAYGLDQVPVEVEGKTPSPKQLQALLEEAKAKRVKAIFVQPQFNRTSAEHVAASIGAKVVVLDPLAEDVLRNLEEMAARIANALAA